MPEGFIDEVRILTEKHIDITLIPTIHPINDNAFAEAFDEEMCAEREVVRSAERLAGVVTLADVRSIGGTAWLRVSFSF